MKSGHNKLIALLVLSALMLAACGSNSGTNAGKETEPSPQGTEQGNNGQGSHEQADASPLGKFDPPIEVSTVRMDNGVTNFYDGDTWDSNIWYQAYEDELGIKLKNVWIAPLAGNQYAEKMNVSIASTSLPDFFQVDGAQMQQLADAGQIMELNEIYDTFAMPELKEMLTLDQGIGMRSATVDGKLMGLPVLNSYSDYAGFVWVRTDWLEKYSLAEPKSMEDVWNIAETFKREQAGGPNTVGLPLRKDLLGDLGGVQQIFQGYHAYPGMWLEDGNGSLAYGSIQPEMKAALVKLQEMYQAGVIDREYGVKDYQKVCEVLTSGQAGIYFGGMADPLGCTQAGHDLDGALWKPLPLVSHDDQIARPGISVSPGGFYVVNKNAKNPEALIKMLNLYVDKWSTGASGPYFQAKQTGETQPFHYAPFQTTKINENVDFYRVFARKQQGEDVSGEKQDYLEVVQRVEDYLNGNSKEWAWYAIFGTESTQQVIDYYLANDLYIFNGYYGPGTETMQEKNAILTKMESEMITRIIMGSATIEEFDKFVGEWKKLGGDKITEEVNAWAKARD